MRDRDVWAKTQRRTIEAHRLRWPESQQGIAEAIEDLRKLRAATPPIDLTVDELLADDGDEPG